MQVVLVLSLLACWLLGCYAADTLIANATSYNANDPITLTFTTTVLYSNIEIEINGVIIGSVSSSGNTLTGTFTFNSIVTCDIGVTGGGTLAINAVTKVSPNSPSIVASVTPNPAFDNSACVVYFTVPATDPAELNAGSSFTPHIHSTIALSNAHITLNGQFFCNLGTVAAGANASCTGFVPCFLPLCAKFAIDDQQTELSAVTYLGPTVQLIPSAACAPSFAAVPMSAPDCPNPFAPLSTIEFTFTVSTNDNISEYSNFEIWASNVAFPSSIVIARVSGPLCTLVSGASTYLIDQFVIPCSFNRAGSTTFTLTFTQTLGINEKRLRALSTTVVIGLNIECNLTLVMNFAGDCPLPHNLSDCGCLGQGSGSSLVSCKSCSVCPLPAFQENGPFIPGDTLNFHIHNGSIGSIGSSLGVNSDTQYYSNPDAFTLAVSAVNFYVNDLIVGGFGYKPIGDTSDFLMAIPDGGAGDPFLYAVAHTSEAGEDIWVLDGSIAVYCGTLAGLQPAMLSALMTLPINLVTVGPTGVWVVDCSGAWFNKATTLCIDASPWIPVTGANGIPNAVESGATGVYILNTPEIQFMTSPLSTPFNVSFGGPENPTIISASNLDDSLAAYDTVTDSIWLLSGPTGTWIQTSFTSQEFANYNFTNLYIYTFGAPNVVNHVTFGTQSVFNVIPTYTALSLIIESSLSPLTIYSSGSPPAFDSYGNALAASWAIPSSYEGLGSVTAVLTYTAKFSSSIEQLTSSVTFSVGPSPVDLSQPRSSCPVPSATPAVAPI